MSAPAHHNSLDALRLLAAAMVLYSHQHALMGLPEPGFLGWNTLGGGGVSIFFFLSGHLVWTSWCKDPRVFAFFQRRLLRIFPALWVVVVLSIFVLGPLVSALNPSTYFAHPATWMYLDNAWLSMHYALPGVFLANAHPGVVNGSLWSLPVEFSCYVVVALAGWGVLRFRRDVGVWVALLWVLAVVVATYGPKWAGAVYATHLEMVALFAAGMVYGQARIQPLCTSAHVLVILGFFAFAVLGSRGWERSATTLVVAAAVHWTSMWPGAAGLSKWLGDLSYGVYIYAFPIQQWVVQSARAQGWGFGWSLVIAAALTFTMAYVSWYMVEKPALAFKPRRKGGA